MHRANARSDAVDLKHFCTFRMLEGLPLRPRYFTWKTTIGIGIYVDNKVVLQSKILDISFERSEGGGGLTLMVGKFTAVLNPPLILFSE